MEIVKVHHFPDGESLVTLPSTLPKHVIFLRSLDAPNDKLVELMFAAETARDLGVESITLIAPYLCYMRQDVAFHPGEAVSQKIAGSFLASYFDRVVTVSPHLHRTESLDLVFPETEVHVLNPFGLIADHLKSHFSDELLLLGPDEESEQWVAEIAKESGFEYSVARKVRMGDMSVSVELPELTFQDRTVVLVDDIISTGRTLIEVARQLADANSGSVYALAVHPLFAESAEKSLSESVLDGVWSTDSVVHESNVIHLAPLIAGSISKVVLTHQFG